MEVTTDIAIIGGGLAAFAAAVELKGTGLEVAVIAKAPGGTALNSGAWDLADWPARQAEEPWQRALSFRACLEELLHSHHPYARIAESVPPGGFADFLWQRTERCAQQLPLAMARREGRNLLMPADLGTIKPTAFVQASMLEADLAAMQRAKVLVVGIKGYPQFNPRFVRSAILEAQEQAGAAVHVEFAGYYEAEIPALAGKDSLTGVEIAQCLDEEESFVPFGQAVLQFLQGKVYSHLLFPPVLGMRNTTAIVEALTHLTGLKVAETLATPMSVPGWRLQDAIGKYFDAEGIELLEGEVVGYDCEGARVKSLRIHAQENRIRLNARAFILATGKYIGGGIRREGRFQEPCFHLPVTRRGKVLSGQSIAAESGPEAAAIQDFLAAGVAVNPRMQPIDPAGNPIFENLFAAGSVLADFDPVHQRSAAGVSIASGTVAAAAAKQGV